MAHVLCFASGNESRERAAASTALTGFVTALREDLTEPGDEGL